jgi:hypothetical protein
LRRLHLVASQIEAEFEHARLNMGVAVDQALLQPISIDYHSVSAPSSQSLTLSDAYERYMNDPTHSWSARTREAYETSRKLAVSVIGADQNSVETVRCDRSISENCSSLTAAKSVWMRKPWP